MTEKDGTTLRRPETRTGEVDSDGLAHIVMKGDQMRGYFSGEPIKALYGKIWVPSRDYQGLPVCQSCAAERERLLAGMRGLN